MPYRIRVVPTVLAGLLVLAAVSPAAHDGLHERLEALTRAIERRPGDAGLYVQRAELRRLHGELALAASDLRQAGELEPEHEGLLLARARLELDAGGLGSARELVDRHLADHPDDPAGLLLRAHLLERCGSVAEAVRDYDRALACVPRPEPDACLARAEAAASLGPDGVQQAVAGLDLALEQLGPVVSLELRAIDLERELGRFDDALARLDRVAEHARRQESWLFRRGEILAEAGRPAEALGAFEAAWVAIDALSPRQRSSAATRELESALLDELSRLSPTWRARQREDGTGGRP